VHLYFYVIYFEVQGTKTTNYKNKSVIIRVNSWHVSVSGCRGIGLDLWIPRAAHGEQLLIIGVLPQPSKEIILLHNYFAINYLVGILCDLCVSARDFRDSAFFGWFFFTCFPDTVLDAVAFRNIDNNR